MRYIATNGREHGKGHACNGRSCFPADFVDASKFVESYDSNQKTV